MRRWTILDILTALSLLSEGSTRAEVADALGASRWSSVRASLVRHGYTSRLEDALAKGGHTPGPAPLCTDRHLTPWGLDEVSIVATLTRADWTTEAIARRIGRSSYAVAGLISSRGILDASQ